MSFAKSNAKRDRFVNEMLPPRLADPVELFINLPLVQQVSERHQPHFFFGSAEQCDSVENQSGEEFLIGYALRPIYAFFDSSLLTSLFVPFSKASIIASLKAAISNGVVKSSTASWSSSSHLSVGFCKL